MVKIVQKEDPILRQKAQAVPADYFGSEKLKKIIAEMKEALDKEEDGAALAAPQIGLAWQIFIISDKILEGSNKKKEDLVFINPKLSALSKTKAEVEEGCLSVRWLYGQVKRSTKAKIEAYDFTGKKFSRAGTGLMAQIFQHEMDHLNGTLFIDKAKDLQTYGPEQN